ncbi:hypothetical protein W97_04156 [Coniosporium apollinis CBS 100218]|uniref:Uncharacterized protein n=1 Tax=Coniosporium apollinis (strain CBS 100218) TaxID=1168221 RepID=R7YSL3_CONA1|nr:uncharacterized protein W97_04156 [Coniosporium apollinis CBS 100218]EON64922.1 hypothetical protein W97_04156 [Coniosporium apollinis CBS 100218]
MAAATAPPPPPFNPVDTSASTASLTVYKDEVESPSTSNSNALARFEFEPGRNKDGTKILMVEWEDDDSTRGVRGDWHVDWEGKSRSTVLRADDQTGNDINRLYFLIPPGASVPAQVTLTHLPAGEEKGGSRREVVWRTNPLPAIFPPELGASARAQGKKGVLHTIWAKKRLQSLQREIETESATNVESVGLTMAVQEKEWIERNFGVTTKPSSISLPSGTTGAMAGIPLSPQSPRSPGGGRLMEKLKGLRLGTTERELGSRAQDDGYMGGANPLSPEGSDVAVSSFATFKGAGPGILAAKPAQRPEVPRTAMMQIPPPSILAQQQQRGGMASLNAFAGGGMPPPQASQADEKEDDLFALPISPRSPDMSKSPFSFAASDTKKYLQGEAAI